jgi:alkylation response protein AidB-like acyl-CoA dehydrogenase
VSGALDLSDEERGFADVVERRVRNLVVLPKLACGEPGAQGLDAALVELGAPSVALGEDSGGSGLGLFGLVLIAEALGRHAVASDVVTGALAARLLAEGGASGWIDGLATGGVRAAVALNEGEGAWAPDTWRLDGERLTGGRLGLVEAGAGARLEALDGMDASRRLNVLELRDAEYRVLGTAPLGERLFSALSVLAAAEAWGAASRALEMSVDYAKTRRQFGRPIGAFQALKHQLADMAIEISPARFLVWRAARAWDAEAPETSRWAALAKAHATSVAVRACRAAVRAHGGVGYTQDYPLHLFLRKAMHAYADLGAPARHRERAAALAGWGRG